jgi:heterodisulfide reductase subunit A
MSGLLVKNKAIAVIGGGVAGLTVAREISFLGCEVVLIEKDSDLGGHAARLACKATRRCLGCNGYLAEDLLRAVSSEGAFHVKTGTKVGKVEREGNRYKLSLLSADGNGRETGSLAVDAVVVCTGYEPFDPRMRPHYNFGILKNMVTAIDAEKMLREKGSFTRPTDGLVPRSVAFVQCVGSRDARLGHQFCSRVCCGYAIRMGLKIVHEHPGTMVSVFYMDIQNFGKDFERYHEKAKGVLRFIRGLPGDFYATRNDAIRISFFSEETGMTAAEDFDLVVLSVGMMPCSEKLLRDDLGLAFDADGFLMGPKDDLHAGVFVAGSSCGPMDVAESIANAKAAALAVSRYLVEN